jgi:hypothetical protein
MAKAHIIGKITFSSNHPKRGSEWHIKEHQGMFKPTGDIEILLDPQASKDILALVNKGERQWLQDLNGHTIEIIIH